MNELKDIPQILPDKKTNGHRLQRCGVDFGDDLGNCRHTYYFRIRGYQSPGNLDLHCIPTLADDFFGFRALEEEIEDIRSGNVC